MCACDSFWRALFFVRRHFAPSSRCYLLGEVGRLGERLFHPHPPQRDVVTTHRMASLFSSLFSRAPQVPENVPFFPYKIADNPYQCKKTWPPDFTKLSQKHQFRLERRYRRRAKLKWARPNWTKGVKLAQWGSIVFVCVYGVLFLDVGDGGTPFDGVRYVTDMIVMRK